MGRVALLCALAGCVYVPTDGDPAAPDRPAPAPRSQPPIPQAARWDGSAFCSQPFSSPFGWLDPIGHELGWFEPVEHLALVQHDTFARGVVIPSPILGANDHVDIDGDWNYLIRLDAGQEALLANGNFSDEYVGAIVTEIDHADIPEDMWPREGDRVAARGDWVVDCWHDDATSEIHPGFAVTVEREGERYVNFVRRSGVWTDVLDGIRVDRIDPDDEMTFDLLPDGAPIEGQRAVLDQVLDERAVGLLSREVVETADGVHLSVRISEDGSFYGHYRVAWR